MKCPHCNGEHPDDTKFCPNTGKKIEPMFKACKNPECPDNGKYILPLDSNFCPTCGKPLEDESSQNQDSNMINGHEYVDLGLPSGTLWARCNVGASSPSDYGDYFAWGETNPKDEYEWDNLEYCNDDCGDEFSKYGDVDDKTSLEMQDDAARANLGGSWRMPTHEEWEELYDNCTWEWTTKCGHDGYKVTSNKNNNSIFLPASGCCDVSSSRDVGISGHYWSSSLSTEDSYFAYGCFFYWSDVYPFSCKARYSGLSVRPVSSSSQN